MSKTVDVAVIDYGMGNLHSVAKALQHVAPGANVYVGDDAQTILSAGRVVYPGVGAIRDCIGEVKARGLDEVIVEAARSKPLLGICVGMRGLMQHSVENNGVDCLGVFDGRVEFFGDAFVANPPTERLKVPHMGWNEVVKQNDHPLWQNIESGARFYFVHSYYVPVAGRSDVIGATNYGVELAAMLARDNIAAVQFHPEKSHRDGLQLLQNFMQWNV